MSRLQQSLVEAWRERGLRAVAVIRAASVAQALFKPEAVAQAERDAEYALAQAQARREGR